MPARCRSFVKAVRAIAPPKLERVHDILRERRPALEMMLAPRSVAVIGATETEGSVGRTLMENLKAGNFGGTLIPVNPRRRRVFGITAFPRISAAQHAVDLAVVATPAPTVPALIGECVEAGVKGAIIISAGFEECGQAGRELEKQVLKELRGSKMRIIGPNCLGVMRPRIALNATFAADMALPGSVGFISQSVGLCTAILDWGLREKVGFSAFVSVGSMLDVNWGDLIYYLGDDPSTKSIVIYMESIGNARSFLSAAREVALTKPIIVIKVGRSEAASKAAASHTGSLTGNDEVLDAAFRRVGVLRVNTIPELFNMAEVLAKQPRPRTPRLVIVTNAGGPAALATDMLVTSGGQIAQLSRESFDAFNKLLPAHGSRNNPVDLLGDAGAERYAKALEIVSKDPNNDGVLVILTPQAMTEPTATAEQLKRFAKFNGKPILASWMGGDQVRVGEEILNNAGIPTFPYPDTAMRAFAYMWRYADNLRSLYETPAVGADSDNQFAKRSQVAKIIRTARRGKRTLLTEVESKEILAAYGISVVETHIAFSEEEAVKLAESIGSSVVLKVYSATITHKTDVGGVKLNLRGAGAVRRAYRQIQLAVTKHNRGEDFLGVTVEPMIAFDGCELILGSRLDPQFGPVLLFGAGGPLVEVFKDRALALPPLNATLARRVIVQTRIFAALKGVLGRGPADLAALDQLLVRFSQLVAEQRWIKEIDINPLVASASGLIALDARMVLHSAEAREDELPRPGIRPYPSQYVARCRLRDNTIAILRPIRPEDEPLMIEFHKTLSEQSVRFRYFSLLKLETRIAHERLTRICFNDYDREIALVIDYKNPQTARHEILGVGRLSKLHGLDEAEWAIIISDQWQGHGLGTKLLRLLVEIGRKEKLSRIFAHILPDNSVMQHVSKKVGFKLHFDSKEDEWKAELALS
jgi:acetyltransferase